jgi:hypothetical protein
MKKTRAHLEVTLRPVKMANGQKGVKATVVASVAGKSMVLHGSSPCGPAAAVEAALSSEVPNRFDKAVLG